MTPTEIIDLYCERHGPGLFGEPFNTITNLAFVIAGLFAWNLAERHRCRSWSVRALIVLAMTVGVGSAIWHMWATAWAKQLDLVPIVAFQLWFLWLYTQLFLGLSVGAGAACVVGFLAISLAGMRFLPEELLNGSLLYAPALAVFSFLAAHHYVTNQPERGLLAIGLGCLTLALVFRTADEIACPHVPIGTHFVWHLFNGGLFYVVMRAVILKVTAERTTAPTAAAGDTASD